MRASSRSGTSAACATLRTALDERVRAGTLVIPPIPPVAAALRRTLAGSHVALPELAAIAGADATLAAAVRRAAGVTALEQAIFRVGTGELVRIAYSSAIGGLATAPGPLLPLRRDAWRHALLDAALCRELAARRGIDPSLASLAGLLHDLGAVVLLANLEAIALEHAHEPMREDVWQQLVAALHVEAGLLVAARWDLPAPVRDAIAAHHAPYAAPPTSRALVDVVALVDRIHAVLDRAPSAGVAALDDLDGLDGDDRARLATLVPRVADAIERLEPAGDPASPDATALIALPPPLDQAAPVEVVVHLRGAPCHGLFVTPNALGLRGATVALVRWFTHLVVHAPVAPIEMTAVVRACDPIEPGERVIVAQPFALDGAGQAAWHALVTATRGLVAPARGTVPIVVRRR